MPKLIQPKDLLEVATIDLQPGRPSRFLRRLLAADAAEEFAEGVTDMARFAMSLKAEKASNYSEKKLLDHLMGKSAFTMPVTVALALCTVVPEDSSTGATISEGTYTGYARKVIAASALNATSEGSGQMTNSEALTFAACTAGSSTFIGWAVCDSSTKGAGNMLIYGSCTSTVISTTQTPPNIPTNQLVLNAA